MLKINFEKLKMKVSKSIKYCMGQYINIFNQLRMKSEKLSYLKVVEKVLRTLPKNLI